MVKRTARAARGSTSSPAAPPPVTGARDLIVVTRSDAPPEAAGRGMARTRLAEVSVLEDALGDVAEVTPLFRVPAEAAPVAPVAPVNAPTADSMETRVYYRVQAPDQALEGLAERLRDLDEVEGAYLKPLADLPGGVNADKAPLADEPPAVTPDLSSRQGYLDPAPGGVDARYAWTLPGGTGAGVRVVDVEGAWRFTHEDLTQNQGGLVAGTAATDMAWRNHGTAVIGVFGADQNAIGITGIAPDAHMRAVSVFGLPSTSVAIRQAADLLEAGDILLIELHRAGPRHSFRDPPAGDRRAGPPGYIAVEWWPDDFDAIRYAVSRGILVVEAGGNGWEDLDDPLYNTPALGFPADWANPFNRSLRDSGAIIVGAGMPPPGTHGRAHGPDRARCDFSNYGSVFDAQGWGLEVTTSGYGSLQGGTNEDAWYTDTFNGTSSASPVVVGALACVQGVLRAAGLPLLTPARARELLRSTGSLQADGPHGPASQSIGNRPDVRTILAQLLPQPARTGVQFTGAVPPNQVGRWYTAGWPAGWQVIWTVVPLTPGPGQPQITWRTQVERGAGDTITYWLDITNLTGQPVEIEARYAVLNV